MVLAVMHQSNLSFDIPPPRHTPGIWTFKDWLKSGYYSWPSVNIDRQCVDIFIHFFKYLYNHIIFIVILIVFFCLFLQIKLMQRRLTIEQFSRHLGFHCSLTCDKKIALSKEYMKDHRDGLVYGRYTIILFIPLGGLCCIKVTLKCPSLWCTLWESSLCCNDFVWVFTMH